MWLPFHSGVSADGRMPVKLLRQPWGIVLEFPCKREKQETIVGFGVKLNVVFCPQPSGETRQFSYRRSRPEIQHSLQPALDFPLLQTVPKTCTGAVISEANTPVSVINSRCKRKRKKRSCADKPSIDFLHTPHRRKVRLTGSSSARKPVTLTSSEHQGQPERCGIDRDFEFLSARMYLLTSKSLDVVCERFDDTKIDLSRNMTATGCNIINIQVSSSAVGLWTKGSKPDSSLIVICRDVRITEVRYLVRTPLKYHDSQILYQCKSLGQFNYRCICNSVRLLHRTDKMGPD
ncbi:hypothetical protein F2P81_022329 [Scophthalmus maximus]|uniref:Uncharacterized protein n=1 Tax=Scophthalmus maximus TaxID=52904 RepID=A0A6A4RZY8_SCOMX|nr:hypothetical protein F2P81_022329 [Scophthalmus maximus]